MTFDEMLNSPEVRDEVARIQRRERRVNRLTRWMLRIPLLGQLTYTFWFCILTEGPYQTCKPRWGALTFSFLNDGCRPTLWHTIRQVTHDNGDPYTGIYVSGAPRSLAEAQRWEREDAA